MKKIIIALFAFAALTISAQKQPMATTNEVAAVLKGLTLEKTIPQDSIAKLNGIILEGANASKYQIVSYTFFVNYDKRTTNDSFSGSDFTPEMKAFFASLEKNCHVAFKDILVKNTETGANFLIDPLNITIHVDPMVSKKGHHSKH
jgi:hypothetical protein